MTGWKTAVLIAAGYGKRATANSLTGKAVGNVITASTEGFKIVADFRSASRNVVQFPHP